MNKRERAKEGEATEEQQEQHRDQEQEVRSGARNQNSHARDLACKQQRLQARELQHSLYHQGGLTGVIADTGTLGLPDGMPNVYTGRVHGTGNIYQVGSANEVKEWHRQHSVAGVKLGLPMGKLAKNN